MIEHENTWGWLGKVEDFWKLCFYMAPLRVFIGSNEHEAEARESATLLAEFYQTHEYEQMPEAETLIMLGWNWPAAGSYEWARWVLKGNARNWCVIS